MSKKPSPWAKWHTTASKQYRAKVDPEPEPQAKAWAMVEKGACAYQNRAGLLCDIGVPRNPKHRWRVFTFQTDEATAEVEA